LPNTFPRADLHRTSEHWRVFAARKSPLTGSPRLATNPANAILNYLYSLVEKSRLAAAACGLDPGLGVLHVDTPNRDSLACDLQEAVRPKVDAFVLDWLMREPLRRSDFFEERNGNCRLMGSFASRLGQTALTWGRFVVPYAEYVVRTLWAAKPERRLGPATRLTQSHRREAKGEPSLVPEATPPDRIAFVGSVV